MIRELIKDSLSALSILFVFITVLFGLKHPVIVADFTPRDVRGRDATLREKNRLVRSLFLNTVPVVIANVAALLVVLPLLIETLKQKAISFVNPDVLPSLFAFICMWEATLATWSIYLLLKSVLTIRKYVRKTQAKRGQYA